MNPYGWIDSALTTLHKADWYRSVQAISGLPGPEITVGERTVLNFSSNNYLGLAEHPALRAAAIAAIETYGTGSTGSRLVTGHRPLHRDLEIALAQLKQTEDALVFSSGYLANLGAVSALVGKRDVIFSDQYNHASLKQGAQLSGAQVLEYAHSDLEALASRLQQRHQYRRALIITDSVFSMDGDVAPLRQIVAIAQTYECMVLVDEAHATGVLGRTGAGAIEAMRGQISSLPVLQVGTLSKALGSLGGYVAGPAAVIDFLRNRAASWIYTTGLSPADTAAALAAVQLLQAEPQRRQALQSHMVQVRSRLAQLFAPPPQQPRANPADARLLKSDSSIFCIQLPTATRALEVSKALAARGLFIPAIRPPTVPTSRLRLTLMATHTQQHLEQLFEGIQGAIADSKSEF
jgi:8-amino-7-oxononanoate synthase